MTTPQQVLYGTRNEVDKIRKLLLGRYKEIENVDEEEMLDIYELVYQIHMQNRNLEKRFEILEDKLNLIIKLLSKD